MAIADCPTCTGAGWNVDGAEGLHWYEENGYLRRVRTVDAGELLVHTGKPFPESTGFKRCWCNGQLMQLMREHGRPMYWMDEVTDTLRPMMDKLLRHDALAPSELDLAKEYVAQWVEGTAVHAERLGVQYERLSADQWLTPLAAALDAEDIMAVVHNLLDYALDPI